MEEILFCDNMKKESKAWREPMIVFLILSIIYPVSELTLNKGGLDVVNMVLGTIFLLLLCGAFTYFYLYTSKYEIIVTSDEMTVKTVFKEKVIKLSSISGYVCRRYRKSNFYQFSIQHSQGEMLVSVKKKDDLERILARKMDL